jgi:serine/threonine-protein kinase 24/25/MST4
VANGRTAVIIPGDLPSPKALKSPTSFQNDKRNMLRVEHTSNSPQHKEQNSAKVGNHHNNNLNRTNSACLNNLVLPLLSEVSLKDICKLKIEHNNHLFLIFKITSTRPIIHNSHHNNNGNRNSMEFSELRSSFELAERSCPGITDLFVKEMIHKLVPGYSETRINHIISKMSR